MVARGLLGALALAAVCGCRASGAGPSPEGAASADPIAPLHAFEEERRGAVDFARLPPSDHALGADPIALRQLRRPGRYVGLLRGRDAVVLLDAAMKELSRAPAPASPVGVTTLGDEIFVAGEGEGTIARYTLDDDTIRRVGSLVVKGTSGLREIEATSRGGGAIYALDERGSRLFTVPLDGSAPAETRTCDGPFRLVLDAGQGAQDDRLTLACLIDHEIRVYAVDGEGRPAGDPARIRHDGPIWSIATWGTPDGFVIAAGGVEDHPLDRTGGSFGYIDSFVFLYRIPYGGGAPERLAAIDVAEDGIVTPKRLALVPDREKGFSLLVTGYGGDRLLTLRFPGDLRAPPAKSVRPTLPGITDVALRGGTLIFANPLFDAWVVQASGGDPVIVPIPDDAPPRSAESRLGEALFFTHLMAPWNKSAGELSRFTCETCHFEGYVDGRTHHTGRGDVRATTKPLLGLFNNRPHFSRALDPNMATMVHAEFRVAGSRSGHDPWFAAPVDELPWVAHLHAPPEALQPLGMRHALMTFLMDFTHRPNPAVRGKTAFAPVERRGAEAFAKRCESCHTARLVSDVPASRVAPERWEGLVLSREGPIVWGSDGYYKTGIEPYVHEKGARAPSLRRLYKKRPHFTNGSARTLGEVLERVRFAGSELSHAGGAGEGLSAEEREALLAFLELL